MQSLEKGIEELRKYQKHMEMRHPEGGSHAVQPLPCNISDWGVLCRSAQMLFLRCHGLAAPVKTSRCTLTSYVAPFLLAPDENSTVKCADRTAARKEVKELLD